MSGSKHLFLKQLGEHVRNVRLKKNITQFDLASSINKDRQSLQRLESGKINPSIYFLYELSEGLEIPIEQLVKFKFDKRKKKN